MRQRRRLGSRSCGASGHPVHTEPTQALRFALRRRGWRWRRVRHDACSLPRSGPAQERFFELLRHYSFRLFVRDLIAQRDDVGVPDLVRYCTPGVARRYLGAMVDIRLVRPKSRGRFCLAGSDVCSFGATLEWFVARVLTTEFGVPCAWNVRLERETAGGDFDIIGLLEGEMLCVETKSSPPRNIEARQASAFCRRLASLEPDIAIFVNDTQLHMRPKIVPLLRRAYRKQFGRCAVTQIAHEVYRLGHALYVTNSDPDLVENLGRCLSHHLRLRVRGVW